jgi:hypothetical protein
MIPRQRQNSPLEIEQALASIPAHDRDTWIQCGMAIKVALGDAGFDIWDRWSQTAENYQERDARDVWKSFHGTGVGLGTLFYHARMSGWNPPHRPSVATSERERSSTKAYALELWLQARARCQDADITSHPYAIAKGIESAGGAGRTKASGRVIGKDADCIVIPIRDIQTERVQGVQCINANGGKQNFGSVSGNGLLLGNTLDKRLPWFVCEGWASAYSTVFHHQKGNGVCAVAFGKSNMQKLAYQIEVVHNPDEIILLEEQDK